MPPPIEDRDEVWLTDQTAVLLESLSTGVTPDLVDGQLLVTLSLDVTDNAGATTRLPWVAMTPGQTRALIRALAEALLRIAEAHARHPQRSAQPGPTPYAN